MNRTNNRFHRIISLALAIAIMLAACPVGVHALEMANSVPLSIGGTTYYLDFQFVGDDLYCRADQWAQAADCIWKFNSDQKKVYLYDNYEDSIAIFASFGDQEYISDNTGVWVPFFEAAKQSGVHFSAVENNVIYGYRGKPLAEFYKDMDRMFRISRYRVSELINSLGILWAVGSTAARSYAILSTMSIQGFLDAASGKMDQEIYNDIFIELLRTDDSLLGAFVDFGDSLYRPGKVINLLQKAMDEDGALAEFLAGKGFSESEIQKFAWYWAQEAYGNKTLNDLSDFYEFVEYTDLLEILGVLDDLTASIDADAHTIMAMQKVFSNSSSKYISNAASRAVEFRLGSKAVALGNYTFEYLDGALSDLVVDGIEESLETGFDIKSWEKLGAEILVWGFDQALSLTEISDAMMYAEASALIQLELADYYYEHCDDNADDTALMMHSVALLYLRSCLSSWKMFDFDKDLSAAISNAETTILAEIANLMKYTEEDLLQNGTSDETARAITELIRDMLENTEPETTVPAMPDASEPTVDNSYLYQDALAAYAELLQNGVLLWTDNGDGVEATHYQLVDMNLDGLPELVVFAVDDYVSLFHIYAYQQDSVLWVADSLNTCDISKWYNADHDLYITAGDGLYASAQKSTASYSDGSAGFLKYDGNDVEYVHYGIDASNIAEKLIVSSKIVGGVRIGSASDPLAKAEMPEEPWTEPAPEPETEPAVQFDRPADGVYYYSIVESSSGMPGVLWVRLRGPWQDYKSFYNGDSHEGMIGITYEHNAGYEVYFVEYHIAAIYGDDEYTIYTLATGEDDTSYQYYVEPDGFVSRYDEEGNLGTGYGLKICAFDNLTLEIADDCIFADERLVNSSDRIEMSMDEFMDIIDQECAYVWSYMEIHVTVQGGKVTELVMPYIP